jgi:hypothetical protein
MVPGAETPPPSKTLPLNDEESIRLQQLESVIEKSLQSFLVVGRCLMEVRDRKLYREHYATFQDYCLKRWGVSERRGLDLVRSTAVAENLLGAVGALPPGLSADVMRPLTKLPAELQVECWRLASRLTKKPTHFVVSRIVRTIISAIDEGGTGSRQKRSKRSEPEETSFLRTIFLLARTPFPDATLFAVHFGSDHQQASRAYLACERLSTRCEAISQALLHRFPQLQDQCRQEKILENIA